MTKNITIPVSEMSAAALKRAADRGGQSVATLVKQRIPELLLPEIRVSLYARYFKNHVLCGATIVWERDGGTKQLNLYESDARIPSDARGEGGPYTLIGGGQLPSWEHWDSSKEYFSMPRRGLVILAAIKKCILGEGSYLYDLLNSFIRCKDCSQVISDITAEFTEYPQSNVKIISSCRCEGTVGNTTSDIEGPYFVEGLPGSQAFLTKEEFESMEERRPSPPEKIQEPRDDIPPDLWE